MATTPTLAPRAGEHVFETANGDLRLWVAAPDVLYITMRGYGDATPMEAFRRAAPSPRPGQKQYLFFDLGELDGYEPNLRKEMTKWVLERRSQVRALHALVKSRIVAMGVSVANLALGGIITSHTKHAPFQAAFEQALRDRS